MVTTSDERKKSEIEVHTDWCAAVEHWRSSLIRVIFVNYQTSKLQCNYLFYIQVDNIGDAWGFSSIAPITLSESFSGETLTGVKGLCHRRPSWIGVFLLWKMGYLDYCITLIRMCCKKGGHC